MPPPPISVVRRSGLARRKQPVMPKGVMSSGSGPSGLTTLLVPVSIRPMFTGMLLTMTNIVVPMRGSVAGSSWAGGSELAHPAATVL